METNWIILSIVFTLAAILIIILIINNLKDKREYEKQLNTPLGFNNEHENEQEEDD